VSQAPLPHAVDVTVVAIPCAGTDVHLRFLMEELDCVSGGHGIFPHILPVPQQYKRVFAKPSKAHLGLWCELEQPFGAEFDLVYPPRAWELLLHNVETTPDFWHDKGLLYIHCGGADSNESQLQRYRALNITP